MNQYIGKIVNIARCVKLLTVICIVIGFKSLNAQSDTSSVQFFVRMDVDIPIDTITDYLEDLNSTQLWHHNYSGLALWQVQGFPFTMANGTQILNISAVIKQAVRKTKISESDYNTLTVLSDSTTDGVSSCFNAANYSLPQSQRVVKISILDTGIDSDISSSTTSELNYNLTNYTGYDYVNNDAIPDDEHGHGSHIAGIIHSITNGVDSLGNNILFDIKKTHNSQGQSMMSSITKAILDAVDANADIINMSFGMTDTFHVDSFFPLRQAIAYATEKKVLVIAAAGNNARDIDNLNQATLPAAFPESTVISVSAHSCNDSLASFSDFGKYNTDIATLGYKVPGPDLSGGIRYASGTSQATAITTAVAALLGTYSNGGSIKPENIKCALLNGSSNLPALDNKNISEGKLNASTSLNLVQNLQNTYNVTSASNDGPGTLRRAIYDVCGVANITFAPSINGQMINLNEEIILDREMNIIGNGLTNTMINGLGTRAFYILNGGEITLRNLTIQDTNLSAPAITNAGLINILQSVKIK